MELALSVEVLPGFLEVHKVCVRPCTATTVATVRIALSPTTDWLSEATVIRENMQA